MFCSHYLGNGGWTQGFHCIKWYAEAQEDISVKLDSLELSLSLSWVRSRRTRRRRLRAARSGPRLGGSRPPLPLGVHGEGERERVSGIRTPRRRRGPGTPHQTMTYRWGGKGGGHVPLFFGQSLFKCCRAAWEGKKREGHGSGSLSLSLSLSPSLSFLLPRRGRQEPPPASPLLPQRGKNEKGQKPPFLLAFRSLTQCKPAATQIVNPLP